MKLIPFLNFSTKEFTMSKAQIREALAELAKSQGLYCRILKAFDGDESVQDYLESQKFSDMLDLVMFLEQ